MKWVILIFFIVIFSLPAYAVTTVYVQPFTTPSFGHAGTISDPYESWSEPCAALNGSGGLVLVNTGTYGSVLYTNNCSGVSGNPIIFKGNVSFSAGTPGAGSGAPLLEGSSTGGSFAERAIQIQYATHDIEFQNLSVTDANANIPCVFIETDPSHIKTNYDEVFDHNTFSNCSAGSISSQAGDYITVTSNLVHDNGSGDTSFSDSGIHIYQPTNHDSNPGVHILISGNIVYNESKGNCGGGSPCSDGMGIEIDDANHTQGGWGTHFPPYTGEIVIQNNISYHNDGDGHHNFQSNAPTDVVNNTFYQNDQNQPSGNVYGEVTFNNSTQGQIYNNIVIPKSSAYNCGRADSNATGVTIFNANDCYGAATAYASSSATLSLGNANITGNPELTLATADFTPQTGSAAFGAAIGAYAPSTDIFGNARPSAGTGCSASISPDMGAIEVTE